MSKHVFSSIKAALCLSLGASTLVLTGCGGEIDPETPAPTVAATDILEREAAPDQAAQDLPAAPWEQAGAEPAAQQPTLADPSLTAAPAPVTAAGQDAFAAGQAALEATPQQPSSRSAQADAAGEFEVTGY